jgi:hypothetical protein
MLRTHRLPAVRICLLILSILLSTTTVDAFAESADLPHAGVSAPIEQRSSKPRAGRRRSSPARLTECAAVARAGNQRKARKACAVKKTKAKANQPSVATTRWSLARPFEAPVDGGVSPAASSEAPGTAFGPSPEQPASSPESPTAPVEPTPPREPTPPSEPREPTSPSKPSEPTTPTEPVAPLEPEPPVIEPAPPVEPTPPVEPAPPVEPTPPVEPVVPMEPAPPVEPAAPAEPTPPVEPTLPVEPAAPFRFFSPTSFWNESLPAEAPLDTSSAGVVGAFDEEIAAEEAAKKGPANINTTMWSVPIYTVPADQPTLEVTLENASKNSTLQAAWVAVPLPADAQPAAGTDKHLVVWQPSTDRLWEFWDLEQTSSGWQAAWGGAIEKTSSDSGAYGPEAWPGAQPGWGASASSLSIAGGLITLEDLELGQINHALAIALPDVRAGVYASPAQRTDGRDSEPLSLPEGAHLRLDPNLDLASLHLPHLTLMLAEAAQRYGIVVRDYAANVTFYAQDPTPTGANPYTGAHGYFEGKSPGQLLASFPWSHLQLLKMELH